MIKDERLRLLSALGHVVEVLDDLKPCGHSGDEETGEHDADCILCRWEAAMAHAEEEGGVKGGIEPSSPLPLADIPPSPCGKPCDHGSSCHLSAGHVPADRHETEHGCVFFDPRPSVRGTDAVCIPSVSEEPYRGIGRTGDCNCADDFTSRLNPRSKRIIKFAVERCWGGDFILDKHGQVAAYRVPPAQPFDFQLVSTLIHSISLSNLHASPGRRVCAT